MQVTLDLPDWLVAELLRNEDMELDEYVRRAVVLCQVQETCPDVWDQIDEIDKFQAASAAKKGQL